MQREPSGDVVRAGGIIGIIAGGIIAETRDVDVDGNETARCRVVTMSSGTEMRRDWR